ncbi:MAG: hypothetical protein QNJ49_03960 [Mastigocoleus sp. MO_167.B18]|nr:hypothetical protein [Mastigocoleus sp. MO_167.B18]
MNISDLNHLEVVEESNVVGGTSYYPPYYYDTLDIQLVDVDLYSKFDNQFTDYVHLTANTAFAKSTADALGKYTKTDVYNATKAIAGGGSFAEGFSGSAAQHYY